VEHDMAPHTGDDVRYIVVGKSAAAHIYHDQSTTRKAWTSTYLYLRASAPCVAQLLLVLPTETT
jgi:hypothetical protein